MASDARTIVRRVVVVLVVAGALVFAVQGGEFGTLDLLREGREMRRVQHSVDSLQRTVDSLKHYQALVEHDPATQERIAREVFGMVRGDKELLYRFAEPADTGKRP